jgi:hypothetical protein
VLSDWKEVMKTVNTTASRSIRNNLVCTLAGAMTVALLGGAACGSRSVDPTMPEPPLDFVTCNYQCNGDWSHRVALEQGSNSCINEEIQQDISFPNSACVTAGTSDAEAYRRTIAHYNGHEADLKVHWLNALGNPQTRTGVSCVPPPPLETWISFHCPPTTAAQCSIQRNGCGHYTNAPRL